MIQRLMKPLEQNLPDFQVALIIPTGIGAAIGGYGGDAMTLLPLFASICDTVITHPNVANAACFQTLPPNVLYVEGFALDRYFNGEWRLQAVRQNKIGILWDSGCAPEMKVLHENTVRAVSTVYGVAVVAWEDTDEAVQLELTRGTSGRSAGCIQNPKTLFNAADKLLQQGVEAIAVCCHMPDTDENTQEKTHTEDAYQAGIGVDPIAGLEAMISHCLVARYHLPVAHAPIFDWETAMPITDKHLDPKAASEFIVSTFLPCVLTGLAKAPRYVTASSPSTLPLTLCVDTLSALIVPTDALGSLPVLSCVQRDIPVLAVANNTTVMQATAAQLGLSSHVIPCHSYLEALGYLASLKQGITLPSHVFNL